MPRAMALTLVAALLCVIHCGHDDRRTSKNPGPAAPIIIVSIDTLRSDHLPAYGFAGSTPAIDAFRRDAILFARAFSHCPQTLPSHVTIMTGLLPAHAGVRDNLGYTLDPKHPTLATLLKQHGYSTGAAVSSYVLRKRTGIAQGCDFYDDEVSDASPGESPDVARRNGDRTRTVLERWIENASGKRVFAFLHLYEPHAPYMPPAPFDQMKNPYDGAIAYADSIVGRFFQTLKSRGLYDDALIILLSDHGEGLGDHGENEHGIFVYRESIQVPLLIKLPHEQRRGETITMPVGLIDVVPTVLACLGFDSHAPSDGRDIVSKSIPRDRTIYSETYFPRLHLGWHELRSLIGSSPHFIEAPRTELYDDSSDAAELRNLAGVQRREVAKFRASLKAYDAPLQPPTAVDPEDQQKLAALGYIGSNSASGTDLPDPKDRIGTVREFQSALFAWRSGRAADAARMLESLLKRDPKMVDAWGLLAQCYRRLGNRRAAIQALQTAMTLFPNDPHVALALAEAFTESGQLDEAEQHAQIAVAQTPVLAHETLARIALARGDATAAGREIDLALHDAPDRIETLLAGASIRERQRAYDDELRLLDRAEAQIESRRLAPVAGVQADRGRTLLQLHRGADAEAAFARETELFPRELHPWASLALIRAAQGDVSGARATLEQMMRLNPGSKARRVAADAYEAFGDAASADRLRRVRR
jgi:tetratricopeptide (TPR) repeat protein